MKKYRFVTGGRVIIGSALAVGILLFPKPSSGQIFGPVPPPRQTPNIVPLAPVEQLGKDVLFDHTLSDSAGLRLLHLPRPRDGLHGAQLGDQCV